MAYFAEVQNGIVQQVIVANQGFINTLPIPSEWIETSIEANAGQGLRANYAGIGFIYDQTADVFYAPQPFPSWILNKTTWQWQPPIPYPNDGKIYTWDESVQNWVEVPQGQPY